MAEVLCSLSTVDNEVLWECTDLQRPVKPDYRNELIDIFDPMYFSLEPALEELGLSVASVRARAYELSRTRPQATIVDHPTVVEDAALANQDVSLWYFPSDEVAMPQLDRLYEGYLLSMAQQRVAPGRQMAALDQSQHPYCLFATEVRPTGSRMDTHVDGRLSVIGNVSEVKNRGRTLIAHPDLLVKYGKVTIDMMLEDRRTLQQRIYPGNGVAADYTKTPHVGLSDPGESGLRVVLDADYRMLGKKIDHTVYDSYS